MDSRANALSHLRKSLRSGRGEDLPVQKVSVMADDKKGLEEGLQKAQEIIKDPKMESMMGKSPMMPEMDDESESEDMSMMDKDVDQCSPDELKEMVKMLRAKLSEEEQD